MRRHDGIPRRRRSPEEVRQLLDEYERSEKTTTADRPSEGTSGMRDAPVQNRWTTTAGAPLVLKSDRGSAFTAPLLAEFLHFRRILHLLSPPRCPRYYGAIGATIRWLKLATMHQAVLSGDADVWTPGALEKAKGITNTVRGSRQRALAEGTSSSWPVITDAERAHFEESARGFEEVLLKEGGLAFDGSGALHPRSPAKRQAIERALVAHDILHITRRAIPLRIRSRPWEKIGYGLQCQKDPK